MPQTDRHGDRGVRDCLFDEASSPGEEDEVTISLLRTGLRAKLLCQSTYHGAQPCEPLLHLEHGLPQLHTLHLTITTTATSQSAPAIEHHLAGRGMQANMRLASRTWLSSRW